MARYERPTIMVEEGMSEGVYAASGCYTVTAQIHQKQQEGRGDYRIQVSAKHSATHTNHKQILTITFNQVVTYKSSAGGKLHGSTTGTTILLEYGYTQNKTDQIGFGDLVVEADEGLAVTSISLTD